MTTPRVVLLPRRARPFYGRHPWVYAGAIAVVEGNPADGDEVELCSHAGKFVARGFYNSQSKIRVRLYSWSPDTCLDRDFFRARLSAAIALRGHGAVGSEQWAVGRSSGQFRSRSASDGTPLPTAHSPLLTASAHCTLHTAQRLVFSEGDMLSGLTVDRYDRWLVLQFTSLGLAQRREMLADLLVELMQPEGIYIRTERGIGKLEGLALQDGPIRGHVPTEPIVIEENGVRFLVNLAEGQKTGFYLDQRDNRQAVAKLSVGRSVLDAFCYTGGFGLHAARAGASSVKGVDGSEPALALARENARLNQLPNLEYVQDDVFHYLSSAVSAGDRYGMVVLDPPKFARARNAMEEAMRGYRRLQTLALHLLEPNGILVTCCCSGLITMAMLEELLAQIAAEEKRDIQILERRGQAPDHPVSVTCLESSYLKCLICRVQ